MAETLCLDASFLVKLVISEPCTDEAQRLIIGIVEDHGGELIVPSFALAETLSVLRRRVHQGSLPSELAERAKEALLSLPLEEASGAEVYRLAWVIAKELGMPVIYDAVYLAVADLNGATFWTADEALYRKASGKGYIQLLRSEA